MAKTKTTYVCSDCGGSTLKWQGQCPHCHVWNTLSEFKVQEPTANAPQRYTSWTGAATAAQDLQDVDGVEYARVDCGMAELNRVFGGGLVKGSVTLIGGEPGIGKSTLLLQALASLGTRMKVGYISGEESPQQIKLRAERLGLAGAKVRLIAEIELEKIISILECESPEVAVIDSIQTVYSSQLESAPGSVSQVRECAAHLTRFAKSKGVSLILVGHVTKDGSIAGPRVLEHIVDTVLSFESEPGSSFRMLRAVKNRFGAVNDLGVFLMGEQGLEEVANPSSMFLTQHEKPVPGCCVFAALEGNRPFMVEIQALVEDTASPNPRRYASGFDLNRFQMLLAVLNKHAGITAFDQNVYLKVVGGVRLTEPGSDLGAALAAYSSMTGKALPSGLLVFGEVGLAGEIRPVQDADARLREAAKLGFTSVIMPTANKVKNPIPGLNIRYVSRIDQALSDVRSIREAA